MRTASRPIARTGLNRLETRFGSALRFNPQHLSSVLARGIGDLNPAQHARDLFHALAALEYRYTARRHTFCLTLGHLPLMIGRRGHLRQMGDAHDLMALAQLLEHAPDDFRHSTADAGIHFIEDQDWHFGDRAGYGLDREAQTRQLSA